MRSLTSEEIDNILDFLPFPEEVEESKLDTEIARYKRIRLDLEGQLKKLKVYPEIIPKVKEEIKKQYYLTRLQPGTNVGGDASLAIGEPTTQMVLNTGHAVGSFANVTQGVPRFIEILNASKIQKTNMIRCRLSDEAITKEERLSLNRIRDITIPILEEKKLNDIVYNQKTRIIKREDDEDWMDLIEEEDKIWYETYMEFIDTDFLKDIYWRIRLHINRDEMYRHKLTPEVIASLIEEEYGDTRCVFSTTEECIIDVYVDTSNVETVDVVMKSKKTDKATFINDDNKDYYFLHRVSLPYLLDIKVSGTTDIKKIWYSKNSSNNNIGGNAIDGEWIMDCEGTNLRELINNPLIDNKTVISNNVREIFDILGIEAARKFLINELKSIISFGGTYIDSVHYTLLADSMTNSGYITSVNIYGMIKSIVGVLTPASFEQSHKNILDAPAKGVTDDLTTISAQIIMGKPIRMGTGYFDITINKNMLCKHIYKKTVDEDDEHILKNNIIEHPFKRV